MNWGKLKHELTKERGPAPRRYPRWCPSCESVVVCEEGRDGRSLKSGGTETVLKGILTLGLSVPLDALSTAGEQALGWRCPDCGTKTANVERAAAREKALDTLREKRETR